MDLPCLALGPMVAIAGSSTGQSASPSPAASRGSIGGNATSEQSDQQAAEQPAGVSRWKFKPASKEGKPVNCRIYIELDFHLY